MPVNFTYRVVADGVIRSVSSSQAIAIKEARRLASKCKLVTIELNNGMVISTLRGVA